VKDMKLQNAYSILNLLVLKIWVFVIWFMSQFKVVKSTFLDHLY